MKKKKRRYNKTKKLKMQKLRKKKKTIFMAIAIFLLIVVGKIIVFDYLLLSRPKELIVTYMGHIEKQEFDQMYEMLSEESREKIERETYKARNANIYKGIEAKNIQLQNIKERVAGIRKTKVLYEISMDTVAGILKYENQAVFQKEKEGYHLIWEDSLIFPGLEESDKVRVSTDLAKRGNILDRNGILLAGLGTVSSVGIVPSKLQNQEVNLARLAELLEISVESIQSKLNAAWVKEDSFVPIATVSKLDELQRTSNVQEFLEEKNRQAQILAIPGVMMTDMQTRTYSLGEAASHLIGYVQTVTAEDLKKHEGEGYSSSSVIGKSGVEAAYEKKLRGQDGHEIILIDQEGNTKEVLASIKKKDGEDVQLTIDSKLQADLYQQFQEDPGCSVAMNPYTGEVLALVSTPTYDSNDFIRGITPEKWASLSENPKKPLYNRFRQVWCPGSTFKPITAGIGLKTGAFTAEQDFGQAGHSWQKDKSWGSYYVTTLRTYAPATLKNAIIYSDNIYFAQAALKIGSNAFSEQLNQLGFNQTIPFELTMNVSKYSSDEKIESEIQLADSGYGQGQIVMNPLHLASLYTVFLNNGSVLKPYLEYKENAQGEIWIADAFPGNIVSKVWMGLQGVVNNPNGTGYAARRTDRILLGKTGTAELKRNKEDKAGTEIGWFSVFTGNQGEQKPILLVSMVENVKGMGGSGYVVRKDKAVLDAYFAR